MQRSDIVPDDWEKCGGCGRQTRALTDDEILDIFTLALDGSPREALTVVTNIGYDSWAPIGCTCGQPSGIPYRKSIPPSLRDAVYKRDGERCVTCGTTRGLTLDHVIPWSKGGLDTLENLQTMCGPCNSSKGNR